MPSPSESSVASFHTAHNASSPLLSPRMTSSATVATRNAERNDKSVLSEVETTGSIEIRHVAHDGFSNNLNDDISPNGRSRRRSQAIVSKKATMLNAADAADAADAAAEEDTSPRPLYRPAQELPYELKSHSRVFLEERMYSEAIRLLTSLLSGGGSERIENLQQHKQPSPVWLPPPSQLAVLATLAIHPAFTSRIKSDSDCRVASRALQYLRHILTVVGPVQADLQSAFAFGDGSGISAAHKKQSQHRKQRTQLGSRNAKANPTRASRSLHEARGALSEYVDSRTLIFDGDDDDDASGGGGGKNSKDAKSNKHSTKRTNAALRAAGISVDVLTPRVDGMGGSSAWKGKGGNKAKDISRSRGAVAKKAGGASWKDNETGKINGAGSGAHGTDDYGDDHNDVSDARNGSDGHLDDRDDGGDGNGDGFGADEDAVSGRIATRDSIWVRGQDFWRVVGWAMSCSVCEPARWRFWLPWLTLVVDVLEADLAARLKEQQQQQQQQQQPKSETKMEEVKEDEDAPLKKSLLCSYLLGYGSSQAQLRYVVSAILADGTQPVYQREVFERETVTAKKTMPLGKKGPDPILSAARMFDIDTDHFGGFSDDEDEDEDMGEGEQDEAVKESEEMEEDSPVLYTEGGTRATVGSPVIYINTRANSGKLTPSTSGYGSGSGHGSGSKNDHDGIPNIGRHVGYVESVPLRRRLFYLLILAAICFPDDFAPIDVVYRVFSEVLRETEVTEFSTFIETTPTMPSDTAASFWATTGSGVKSDDVKPFPPVSREDAFVDLFRHVLVVFLPLSAPKPRTVDAAADSRLGGVSQLMLERCFLPFAANTVVLGANVRMALVLESLLRIAWQRGQITWTEALQTAAETGVQAREARVSKAKKKSDNKTMSELESFGRDLMQRSGQRLLTMVLIAKMDVDR